MTKGRTKKKDAAVRPKLKKVNPIDTPRFYADHIIVEKSMHGSIRLLIYAIDQGTKTEAKAIRQTVIIFPQQVVGWLGECLLKYR